MRKFSFYIVWWHFYQDDVILLEEKPWHCTAEMLSNKITTFTRAHCCCLLLGRKPLNLPLPSQWTSPKGNKISLWLFYMSTMAENRPGKTDPTWSEHLKREKKKTDNKAPGQTKQTCIYEKLQTKD